MKWLRLQMLQKKLGLTKIVLIFTENTKQKLPCLNFANFRKKFLILKIAES